MTCKRKRLETDIASRAAASKRSRHTTELDLLSSLSDELLIRILTFLPLSDLLNTSPVSQRFYHLSGDYQLWKRLYYSHFVLPRALRIPGFRDGSAREGKLHYSSRKAVWADGRRGGWVDIHVGDLDDGSRDWKKQYKLRHNWSRGKCAVEELQLRQEPPLPETSLSHKVLVKVTEGTAITADANTGLRAWDLKTKQLLAQISLRGDDSGAAPSCIAIDDQKIHQQILEIAVGFIDGGFGVWALDVEERRILPRYRHKKSSNGELVGVAFSYPYLLTATKSVLISMYTFDGPHKTDCSSTLESTREVNGYVQDFENKPGQDSGRIEQDPKSMTLQAPYLLTSLKSHTSRAPLALSIRKTSGSIIASIVYTFSTLQGWSLGMQDLHLHPPTSRSKHMSDIITTRLAYTTPVWNSSSHFPSTLTSQARHTGLLSPHQDNGAIYGPINLCYTHPYLLATLPDNTLILFLCTSNATSLSISPGIRLWGHTSGISDAEITARGKAVSVSSRGDEIRVWELEGRAHGKSIEVRPTTRPTANDKEGTDDPTIIDTTAAQWDGRRNWVGFDDEMVIVLKESMGRESLMVYDFT